MRRKEPGSADPIRVHFQHKRLQNILAVSKQRKISADTSELLTAPLSRIHTTTAPDPHVLMQADENTATTLATYDMPQNALIVHAHWLNLILNGTKTWEIRGENTKKRERIALATTQPYVLLGDVEIVKSTNITLEEFQAHVDLHCSHNTTCGRDRKI